MIRISIGLFAAALACLSCTRQPTSDTTRGYVLLVPDWQNEVVHRIALDGSYEGDFLDPARGTDPDLKRTVWAQPTRVLFFDESPRAFWVSARRTLAEWDGAGRPVRTILADSTKLELPSCMIRVGDEVFVASNDTKDMVVFARDGTELRRFGYPDFYRSNDCKLGPDGLVYVGSTAHSPNGLISIWDPKDTAPEAQARGYRVPHDTSPNGRTWVQGLVFDADGHLLITEFSQGRLERWDLDRDERTDLLLDDEKAGAYLGLERGPDGLVYMAGPGGIYRFDSRAKQADLKNLKPFFDARQIEGRYSQPFSPSGMTFVPSAALGPPREQKAPKIW